ncbi:MAG: ribosome silencing factor [Candidatus Omnitrophica bacterium]|nr:ribosome silencing factor [Candidatus Omnitrophota bacterium]
MDSFHKAKLIAGLIREKSGFHTVIMDMRQAISFADFFVICSADSSRQVKTIADYIASSGKKKEIKIWHSEGYENSSWVLLDCGDVVVHVFIEELRGFYELERLWRDVPVYS